MLSSSLHLRLLLCWFLLVALAVFLQPVASVANDRQPICKQYSLAHNGSSIRAVSVAETSDGVLFIACRTPSQILVFDGVNWEEVALPSAPRALVADQADRVWIAMDDGLGFIQRDALGGPRFSRFELPQQDADLDLFSAGFKTSNGVRFGCFKMLAEIDCSAGEPSITIYRAEPKENFIAWDGDVSYSSFAGKDQLVKVKDGERSVVATDFLPGSIGVAKLSGDRYLFTRMADVGFKIKREGKWENFFLDQDTRLKVRSWCKTLSKGRVGFATPDGFLCYDSQGNRLWSVDEPVYQFGELSNGRIWLIGKSGFRIVEDSDRVSTYAFKPGRFKNIKSIQVSPEGVCLAARNGLFFLKLSEDAGTFPKFEKLKRMSATPANMTWQSGNAQLAATASGLLRIRDPLNIKQKPLVIELDYPISLGFTTSRKDIILSRFSNRLEFFNKEMKLLAEAVLTFHPEKIIEISPTKFWILGNEGEFVVLQFNRESNSCQVQKVEGLAETSSVLQLDGQRWVVTKEGLFSPELKTQAESDDLLLVLQKVDPQFELLNEQFENREICKVIDCPDFGLLLCSSRYFSMHKLVDGQYQREPITDWAIPSKFGKRITWDPYRSVLWATWGDNSLVTLLPSNGESRKIYKRFDPVLEMFVSPEDSISAGSAGERIELPAATDVSFIYGIPNASNNAKFQCRLEGLEEDWSEWAETTSRKYERLPSGEYEFQVRTRRPSGELVSASSGRFIVKKLWYATLPAILLFSLLAFGLVYVASSLRARQLAHRNKKMERLIALRTKKIQKQKKEIEEKSDLLVEHYCNAESEKLKSLGTLVAGISHDFNNLLTAISSNSELMVLRGGAETEELNDNIQAAIQSATDLCGELSAVSVSRPLNLSDDSLGGVVEEVLPLLQGSVPQDVKLEVELCEDPTGVSIDLIEIKRAIVNLVVNAAEVAKHRISIVTSVDYLTEEQLKAARVIGDCPSPGKFASVSVCDDGPGIQEEYLGRLFDPFFTTNELGRGLGLSIVMRVISNHNGVVLVEKSEFGGACFRLCLPLIEQVKSFKPASAARVSNRKSKVLLVDDNSMVLESVESMLTVLGHEVIPAISAAVGLDKFGRTKDIDVVVLDVVMHGMSGVEMADTLLKEDAGFPIVFASGFSNDLIQEELLQLPNVNFLSKPYRVSELIEKIELVCATRRKNESNLSQASTR